MSRGYFNTFLPNMQRLFTQKQKSRWSFYIKLHRLRLYRYLICLVYFAGLLWMTIFVVRNDKLNTSVIPSLLAKPPRQVAPSSARCACHLSRFNGRAYSRKGELPRSVYYGNIKSAGFALPGDPSLRSG